MGSAAPTRWRGGAREIEPYRGKRGDGDTRSEEGRMGRSLVHGQSDGGGPPVPEQGGEGGGARWRAAFRCGFTGGRKKGSNRGASGRETRCPGDFEAERGRGVHGGHAVASPACGRHAASDFCRGDSVRAREREEGRGGWLGRAEAEADAGARGSGAGRFGQRAETEAAAC
jgi:hypothetical protein